MSGGTTVARLSVGALPERLPTPGTIGNGASALRGAAKNLRGHYDDALNSWHTLAGHYTAPEQHELLAAPGEKVEPLVTLHGEILEGAASGLEAFAEDIESLRPRYDAVKSQVATFNTATETQGDDADASARLGAQRTDLAAEIAAVARLYDNAVEACVATLGRLDPTLPQSGGGGWFGALSTGSAAIGTVKGWAGRAKSFSSVVAGNAGVRFVSRRDGFRVLFDSKGLDAKLTRPKLGMHPSVLSALGPLLPAGLMPYLRGEAVRPSGERTARYRSTMSGIGGFVDKRVPGGRISPDVNASGRLKFAYTQHLKPGGVADRAVSFVSKHGDDITGKAQKFEDVLGKVNDHKVTKGLGVAGSVVSTVGEFNDSYNDAVMRNPQGSKFDHAVDATVDTAVKKGSEAAGATVGRVAGAAIGQAIIPIPGVGAAVGGIVGGVVGGHVGSAVGDAINDFRHADGDLGDKIGAGAKALWKGLFG